MGPENIPPWQIPQWCGFHQNPDHSNHILHHQHLVDHQIPVFRSDKKEDEGKIIEAIKLCGKAKHISTTIIKWKNDNTCVSYRERKRQREREVRSYIQQRQNRASYPHRVLCVNGSTNSKAIMIQASKGWYFATHRWTKHHFEIVAISIKTRNNIIERLAKSTNWDPLTTDLQVWQKPRNLQQDHSS